jgi:hypothetical protein
MTTTSRPRNRGIVVFTVVAVAGALAVGPPMPANAEPTPIAPTADGRAGVLEQRPLVEAATMVRTAVEASGFDGLASIVIEAKSVAVWWKGGRQALPGRITAAVDMAGKVAPVHVENAKYSMSELLAASAKLENQLRAHPGFHGINARPDGSGLIVKVDTTGPAVNADAVPDVGVPTTVSIEERMLPISRGNDSPPWSGGAEIVNTSIGAGCTSGFGVNTPGGGRAILTAGHCGNPGNRITDGAGEFIGNVGPDDNNFDVLIVPTSAVTNRIYVGGGNSNQQRTVTSGGAPFIGERLCQSGNTSANAVGGPICNLQVQFEGTDSQRLWEARQLDGQIAARPGDSGGPVYNDRGDGTVIARGTSTRVAGSGFGFAGFEKAQRNFGVSIPGGGDPVTGVVFFQHVNFGGAASQPLAPGSYTLSALQARGFQNDWASSVRVPSGRSVTMFQHDNFQGTQWTLSSDRSSFRTLQPSANDEVSSVIVR